MLEASRLFNEQLNSLLDISHKHNFLPNSVKSSVIYFGGLSSKCCDCYRDSAIGECIRGKNVGMITESNLTFANQVKAFINKTY